MNIRRRPRWQLVKLLRDAGVTQAQIAERVGVDQSLVSRVLSRTASVRPTKNTEAIWKEVEKAVGPLVA